MGRDLGRWHWMTVDDSSFQVQDEWSSLEHEACLLSQQRVNTSPEDAGEIRKLTASGLAMQELEMRDESCCYAVQEVAMTMSCTRSTKESHADGGSEGGRLLLLRIHCFLRKMNSLRVPFLK